MNTILTLDDNQAKYQIRAFSPGQIQVNDRILTNNIIITPTKLVDDWRPTNISLITQKDFEFFLELRPDILIVGTGEKLIFPPIQIYGHLINLNIGIEFMNTAAACRTYNALAAENRHVAAALILN